MYDNAYANRADAYAFLYKAEKDMTPLDSLSGPTRPAAATTGAVDSPACGKLVV